MPVYASVTTPLILQGVKKIWLCPLTDKVIALCNGAYKHLQIFWFWYKFLRVLWEDLNAIWPKIQYSSGTENLLGLTNRKGWEKIFATDKSLQLKALKFSGGRGRDPQHMHLFTDRSQVRLLISVRSEKNDKKFTFELKVQLFQRTISLFLAICTRISLIDIKEKSVRDTSVHVLQSSLLTILVSRNWYTLSTPKTSFPKCDWWKFAEHINWGST